MISVDELEGPRRLEDLKPKRLGENMRTRTFTKRNLLSTILSLTLLSGQVAAQNAQASAPQGARTNSAAASATGAATETGARFTAPGEVLQIRLEIYAAAGELVYDSGARAGGVLDWKVADVQNGVADGAYLCVVTVKDLSGRASRRLATLNVQSGGVSLARARSSELSAAQSQKIEATEADASLAILRDGKERAVTVAAHDGQDGQVTSTSGALTLRTGDVLTGDDKEQMRVTPEGRVGIGTDKPEETLDVAGTIRARGGIRFDDGTVLNSASGLGSKKSSSSSAGDASADGSTPTAAPVAGTGTTGSILKWTDGAGGTAGDSSIFESGGKIGIGIASPQYPLHVANPTFGQFFISGGTAADFLAFHTNAPVNARWTGFRSQDGRGKISSFADSGAYRVENILTWNNANGNIGVGAAPGAEKLEVSGNFKLNGATSGIIFADGTKLTTAAGGGGAPSGTNIIGAINDPATAGAISDARLSSNVARLNGANAWAGANVFGAGLSANGALVTNVGNPVNAGDAVNKAYADASFVKFVPGAEQLSVGDANGTATMINLRGGSTCCSGPGGHTPAFFKVFQNGSFVATGNLGIGVSSMEGAGYRTSWHTYKGAFRSGYADNEWDDANTGFFSWAGGSNSTASGLYAFAFSDTNFARSTSSIAFGNKAQSGGPLVDGKCHPDTFNIRGLAAVAMGFNVTADQDHTTALGKFASNNGFAGTFIWSDGSATASADTFRNTANNEFAARASGGFRFRTNLTGTTGCNLPAGSGVFNCTSSRYTKENFAGVSGEDVLTRLRKVPVTSWNYISEGQQVRHLGPMAEDFYGAFGLGTSDKAIGVQDLAGINLAAAQALDQRTAELQKENAQLRTLLTALEQRLAALEQKAQADASGKQAEAPRR